MKQSVFFGPDPNKIAVELQKTIAETSDFNPWLAFDFGNKGSDATSQSVELTRNLRWQSRRRQPTEYEERLAETLGEMFTAEVWELPAIVARLNALGLPTPGGAPWTEANFESEIAQIEAQL